MFCAFPSSSCSAFFFWRFSPSQASVPMRGKCFALAMRKKENTFLPVTWKHFSTSDPLNYSVNRILLSLPLSHLCMLLRDFNGWDVYGEVMKVLNIHRTVNLNFPLLHAPTQPLNPSQNIILIPGHSDFGPKLYNSLRLEVTWWWCN